MQYAITDAAAAAAAADDYDGKFIYLYFCAFAEMAALSENYAIYHGCVCVCVHVLAYII